MREVISIIFSPFRKFMHEAIDDTIMLQQFLIVNARNKFADKKVEFPIVNLNYSGIMVNVI